MNIRVGNAEIKNRLDVFLSNGLDMEHSLLVRLLLDLREARERINTLEVGQLPKADVPRATAIVLDAPEKQPDYLKCGHCEKGLGYNSNSGHACMNPACPRHGKGSFYDWPKEWKSIPAWYTPEQLAEFAKRKAAGPRP